MAGSYSLLIVDKNRRERRNLEALLREKYPMISTILSCARGIEALEITAEKQIDIIISDIMPEGMTGLELLRRLKEQKYGGKVLFTAEKDGLDYAIKALEEGAVNFMLKPVRDDILKANLENCFQIREKQKKAEQLKEGIESIRSYAQRYLIHDFISGRLHPEEMKSAYGFSGEEELEARVVSICFPSILEREEEDNLLSLADELFSSSCHTLTGFEKNELVMIAEAKEQRPPCWQELSVWVFLKTLECRTDAENEPEWITATGLCTSYQELLDSYRKLKEENLSARRSSILRFSPDLGTPVYSQKEAESRIRKAVWGLRSGKLSRCLGAFSSCFKENSYQGLYLVMQAALSYDSEADIYDLFLNADIEDLQTSLMNWLEENIRSENEEESGNQLIAEAVRIMKRDYASTGLSQASLAEYFGLNPSYFSRVFRKVTGETFISMLSGIRMKKAEELLLAGTPPQQAGALCGYSSQQYFYEAFRTKHGISAKEYAERFRP